MEIRLCMLLVILLSLDLAMSLDSAQNDDNEFNEKAESTGFDISDILQGFGGTASPDLSFIYPFLTQLENGGIEGLFNTLGLSPEAIVAEVLKQSNTWFIEKAKESGISELCVNETLMLVSDYADGKEYAKRIMASIPAFPNMDLATFELQNEFSGNFELCTRVTKGSYDSPMDAQYCQLYLHFGQDNEVVNIANCMPATCSEADANAISQIFIRQISEDEMFSEVSCVPRNLPWGPDSIFVMFLLCAFGTLVLIGTIYEGCIRDYISPSTEEPEPEPEGVNEAAKNDEELQKIQTGEEAVQAGENQSDPPPSGQREGQGEVRPVRTTDSSKNSVLDTVLLSFSCLSSIPKVLSAKKTSGSLDCLNGLRVLSMFWIIWGHFNQLIAYWRIDNRGYVLEEHSRRFWIRVLYHATYSVDNFFVLSGLLVSYLTLKKLKTSSGKMNWALYVFHRFWRITPFYMVCIGIFSSLAVHFGSGPGMVEIFDASRAKCRDYWWTNLLYVNNLIPYPGYIDGCLAWSWYLANDMQFFLITPFLLVFLYTPSRRRLGLIAIGVLASISFVSLLFVNGYHGYPVGNVQIPYNNNSAVPGGDYSYTKPWCRINAYLVGVLVGYLLYRTEKKKLLLSPIFVIAGWTGAFIVLYCLLFMLHFSSYEKQLPQWFSILWLTFDRTLWSIAIGWILFTCIKGYGGIWNRILSWSAWLPMARLTFGAYLLHPIVIVWFISSKKAPFHWTMTEMSFCVASCIVVTYLLSFVLSILIEAPTIGIEKALLRKKR